MIERIPHPVECWRVLELEFTAHEVHADPYRDLELDVIFAHDGDLELTMPAFWDGERCWKVRFAAPETGAWTYCTQCSDSRDSGLHAQTGSFDVTPYTGNLALCRHGFLRVSQNRRYLEHADGTPFYWLGDTHWLGLSAKERFEESNDPRFASQFKGIIEKRLEQGYTVWAGSLMLGEWNDASGSPTPLWGTHLEDGQHPWHGTGYRITASSGVHQADFTGFSEGHAVDGYVDTRWQAKAAGYPQWLSLDLGAVTSLSRVALSFPSAETWAYQLQGSLDGQAYTTLCERVSSEANDFFSEVVSGTYQYVRVTLTSSSTEFAGLCELNVYDSSGGLMGNQDVLKRLNLRFWQLLDRRIAHIADSGLLLNLGLDWGRNLQHSAAMLSDYQRVARYVLARYGAYPSVYFTAGEPQQSSYFEGWKQILETVYDLDPYKRPATLHAFKPLEARGFKDGLLELRTPLDRSARGFGFLHLQTEEYGQGEHHLEEWFGEYHGTPTLPMIEAETGYEKVAGDGYEQRWSAWQSQMAGACGYTYGAYGIWSATWDDNDHWNTFGTHTNWFEAIDFAGGEHMRHVAAFFKAIPWQTLEPAPDAIQWVNAPLTPTARPLIKAVPDGSLTVAYLPRCHVAYSGHVRGLEEGVAYRAAWFNPRSGEYSRIEMLARGWVTPVQPDAGEDWILSIRKGI